MKRILLICLILCALFTSGCSITRERPYFSVSPYEFKNVYDFIEPEVDKSNIVYCKVLGIEEKRKIKNFDEFDKGLEYYYPIKVEIIKSYYGNLKKGDIIYVYSNGNNSSSEYFDLKKGFKGILNLFVVPDDIRKDFLNGEIVYNYFGRENYVLEIDDNSNVKNKDKFSEKDFYYGIENLSQAELLLNSAVAKLEASSEKDVSTEETGENSTTKEPTKE